MVSCNECTQVLWLVADDIQVWLYEEKDGNIVWEAQADFNPAQVHKQVAISFTTPKYKTVEVLIIYLNMFLRR